VLDGRWIDAWPGRNSPRLSLIDVRQYGLSLHEINHGSTMNGRACVAPVRLKIDVMFGSVQKIMM
jgi:hypothetical protein